MQSEFDREILAMNREILALKQQREKSANILHTQAKNVTLTFNLELVPPDNYVRSDKMAVISIDSGNNNPLLGMSFNITGLDNRVIRRVPIYNQNTGKVGFMVFLYSNNPTDMSTLAGGGTVTVSYSVTLSATADFTPTVTYSDLWVN